MGAVVEVRDRMWCAWQESNPRLFGPNKIYSPRELVSPRAVGYAKAKIGESSWKPRRSVPFPATSRPAALRNPGTASRSRVTRRVP